MVALSPPSYFVLGPKRALKRNSGAWLSKGGMPPYQRKRLHYLTAGTRSAYRAGYGAVGSLSLARTAVTPIRLANQVAAIINAVLCVTIIFLGLSPNIWARDGSQHEAPFLPSGTILKSVISTKIVSFNLESPVIAELPEGATFLGRKVLPEKTKFLGRALVLKSHDRVNIEFNLAVLPDGREIGITGIALSPDGSSGIIGRVEKVHDSAVASAALKGAIMGATSLVSSAVSPIASQAGQAVANEAVNEVDQSQQEVDTSISIDEFTRCLIFLSRRVEIIDKAAKTSRLITQTGERQNGN